MPWEIIIRRTDGALLGDVETIKNSLSAAFPGVKFYQEPSGLEKIAAARNVGVEFPEVLRRHFEQAPAKQQGDFDGDGFSVRFFLYAYSELATLDAEVRGETRKAIPFLKELAAATRWVVVEPGRKEPFIV